MNESYSIKGTKLDFNPTNTWVSTRVEIDISDQTLDRLAKIFAPVQHGHWIWHGSYYTCSVCGEEQYGVDTGRFYCQNCGAKMDEERKEND